MQGGATTNVDEISIIGGADVELDAAYSSATWNITTSVNTQPVLHSAGSGGTTFKIKKLPQIIFLGNTNLYWTKQGATVTYPAFTWNDWTGRNSIAVSQSGTISSSQGNLDQPATYSSAGFNSNTTPGNEPRTFDVTIVVPNGNYNNVGASITETVTVNQPTNYAAPVQSTGSVRFVVSSPSNATIYAYSTQTGNEDNDKTVSGNTGTNASATFYITPDAGYYFAGTDAYTATSSSGSVSIASGFVGNRIRINASGVNFPNGGTTTVNITLTENRGASNGGGAQLSLVNALTVTGIGHPGGSSANHNVVMSGAPKWEQGDATPFTFSAIFTFDSAPVLIDAFTTSDVGLANVPTPDNTPSVHSISQQSNTEWIVTYKIDSPVTSSPSDSISFGSFINHDAYSLSISNTVNVTVNWINDGWSGADGTHTGPSTFTITGTGVGETADNFTDKVYVLTPPSGAELSLSPNVTGGSGVQFETSSDEGVWELNIHEIQLIADGGTQNLIINAPLKDSAPVYSNPVLTGWEDGGDDLDVPYSGYTLGDVGDPNSYYYQIQIFSTDSSDGNVIVNAQGIQTNYSTQDVTLTGTAFTLSSANGIGGYINWEFDTDESLGGTTSADDATGYDQVMLIKLYRLEGSSPSTSSDTLLNSYTFEP